jgi:hypothetical protein
MDGQFLRNIDGKTGRDRIRNEVWIQNLLARVKKETERFQWFGHVKGVY